MDYNEANYYKNYLPDLRGAKISVVPGILPIISQKPLNITPYEMAEQFIETVNDSQDKAYLEDFFNQKKELSDDRVNLVLGEIHIRETLKNNNLAGLYDDLLRVSNWRHDRPFPDYFKKDKIWSDLNRMELQIREQIRRELKDAARDTSFPQKDLRESLLDFKLQSQKAHMLQGGLEMSLEGSYQPEKGDLYQHQNYSNPKRKEK